MMNTEEIKPATATRQIDAPAGAIFVFLAEPARHTEIDGSGMLRGMASGTVVSGIGEVFAMKMHHPELGDYQMNNLVVDFKMDRRIGWEPAPGMGHPLEQEFPIGTTVGYRWIFELTPDGPDVTTVTEIFDCSNAPEDLRNAVDNGNVWVESMEKTLERLDEICTTGSGG
jgi:hypothetical protein